MPCASILVFHLQMQLGDLEERESGSPPGLSSGAVAGIACGVLVATALVGECATAVHVQFAYQPQYQQVHCINVPVTYIARSIYT